MDSKSLYIHHIKVRPNEDTNTFVISLEDEFIVLGVSTSVYPFTVPAICTPSRAFSYVGFLPGFAVPPMVEPYSSVQVTAYVPITGVIVATRAPYPPTAPVAGPVSSAPGHLPPKGGKGD